MYWADDLEAVGFSATLLSFITTAVDNGQVDWVRTISGDNPHAEGRYREFDYLGFRYGMDEAYEVISIEPGAHGRGVERHEFVAFRVEKIAKVDEDDDGNTIIVEKYPLTNQAPKQQSRPESWGTF